jgi:transcriptional regulator NrdR family protein
MAFHTICRCGGTTTVIDSRAHGTSIRRRRRCDQCGERWSTREIRGTFQQDKPALMRAAKAAKKETHDRQN